jgi:hypothetical protein
LIGVEKEADLAPLFECLLPFFPKCSLCIHMIGASMSDKIPQDKRALLMKSASNDSTVFISLNQGVYAPTHYDATQFKLPDNFPKEMLKEQNFGQDKPDLVIALNAGLLQHNEWAPTLKFLAEQDGLLYVTERMEQGGVAAAQNMHMIGGAVRGLVEPNPFRQPTLDFKKDVNIPGWSNGYVFVFGKA